jgi:hypothetical protein
MPWAAFWLFPFYLPRDIRPFSRARIIEGCVALCSTTTDEGSLCGLSINYTRKATEEISRNPVTMTMMSLLIVSAFVVLLGVTAAPFTAATAAPAVTPESETGNPGLTTLLFYTCVSPQVGNQCEEGALFAQELFTVVFVRPFDVSLLRGLRNRRLNLSSVVVLLLPATAGRCCDSGALDACSSFLHLVKNNKCLPTLARHSRES